MGHGHRREEHDDADGHGRVGHGGSLELVENSDYLPTSVHFDRIHFCIDGRVVTKTKTHSIVKISYRHHHFSYRYGG